MGLGSRAVLACTAAKARTGVGLGVTKLRPYYPHSSYYYYGEEAPCARDEVLAARLGEPRQVLGDGPEALADATRRLVDVREDEDAHRACLLAVRGLLGMFGEVKGHPREKSNLKDNSPKQTRPRGGRGCIAFATQKELLRQYRPSHLTLWRGGSGWAWTTGHPLSGAASCPLLHSSMHSGCG